jgi:hypothetical protein
MLIERVGSSSGVDWASALLTVSKTSRLSAAIEGAFGGAAGPADVPVLICAEDEYNELVDEGRLLARARQIDPDPEGGDLHGTVPGNMKLAVATRWREVGVKSPPGVSVGDPVVLLAADRFLPIAQDLQIDPASLLDAVVLHEVAHHLDGVFSDGPAEDKEGGFATTRAEHRAQLFAWNALSLLPAAGEPGRAMEAMRGLTTIQPSCYRAFLELPSVGLSSLPAVSVEQPALVVPYDGFLALPVQHHFQPDLHGALDAGSLVYLVNTRTDADRRRLRELIALIRAGDEKAAVEFDALMDGRPKPAESGVQEVVGPWRVIAQDPPDKDGDRRTDLGPVAGHPLERSRWVYDPPEGPLLTPVLFDKVRGALEPLTQGTRRESAGATGPTTTGWAGFPGARSPTVPREPNGG